MFNPFDYDDQTAVNKPYLNDETIKSITSGIKETSALLSRLIAEKIRNGKKKVIIAFDGYIGAQWKPTLNLINQNLRLKSIKVTIVNFSEIFYAPDQLDKKFTENLETDLEKDPVLLFGKLFHGNINDFFDKMKAEDLKRKLKNAISGKDCDEAILIYGCGSAVASFRQLYDLVLYYDVTPKKVILRARNGMFVNLGDTTARPIKELLRRCYYIDFEVAGKHRKELLNSDAIDYYVASDDQVKIKTIPRKAFRVIMEELVKYPMRCKPVYLEGVWGGQYIKKLRNLPSEMRNCAWVFDLIPLEVSILAEAGEHMLEFPFFTFVQKEGMNLMGNECVRKFNGYFPVRFNYDDTYHGNGNMSIQVHSGHEYNINNFGEHGRQDESYYVVATGHGARTFLGFREDADPGEFVKMVKASEKKFTPVDYEKYINHEPSKPGVQFLIPAGTIHSSGRNQVVLEIGSLTVGSYTFKMYDYLRADLDGVPRPIHTYHGEKVIKTERTSSWVKKNLIQEPVLVRKGEKFAEYIVGQHDLLYFSLRRLEFEDSIEDNTEDRFHVLNLVDGEQVIIESIDHPERNYVQNFLDMVIVPACMGRYRIRNLGNQPVCIHKTMLKDGFSNDAL